MCWTLGIHLIAAQIRKLHRASRKVTDMMQMYPAVHRITDYYVLSRKFLMVVCVCMFAIYHKLVARTVNTEILTHKLK